MIYVIECSKCGHQEQIAKDQCATIEAEGWHCWNIILPSQVCNTVTHEIAKIPETADDIKVIREEYNRKHADAPGFVPSVEYVRGPDGKNIPKES